MKVHDFLFGFVDDELKNVGVGDENIVLVCAHLEKWYSKAVFLLRV